MIAIHYPGSTGYAPWKEESLATFEGEVEFWAVIEADMAVAAMLAADYAENLVKHGVLDQTDGKYLMLIANSAQLDRWAEQARRQLDVLRSTRSADVARVTGALKARIESTGDQVYFDGGGWSADIGWPKDTPYPDITL